MPYKEIYINKNKNMSVLDKFVDRQKDFVNKQIINI